MIYCAFVWSFALFLEQIFVAELYLWHLIWEREVKVAQERGEAEPALADVKHPCVLDDVPDLFLTRVMPRSKRLEPRYTGSSADNHG